MHKEDLMVRRMTNIHNQDKIEMTTKRKSKKQIDNSIPDWFTNECAFICGEDPETFELGF